MLWIAAIFLSFGINAPRHATMYVVFVVLSFAIGSAIFLVLEMGQAIRWHDAVIGSADRDRARPHAAGRNLMPRGVLV